MQFVQTKSEMLLIRILIILHNEIFHAVPCSERVIRADEIQGV